MKNPKKNTDSSSQNIRLRHSRIIDLLTVNGSVSVTELSEMLNVSEVTIRKDLSLLEEQHKLYRTHGRAIPISSYISDRHVNEKEKQNILEKREIGKRAAQHITPNDTIIIASGTTMLYFAREIEVRDHLTVVTSSIPATAILSQKAGIDVIQLGGSIRGSSVSAVGSFAEQMLEEFNCSKLFLGVDGIDLEFGLTTTNLLEAQLNRKMMVSAQKTVVLADSTKFGRRGFSKICPLEQIDEIITDDKIAPALLDSLRERGITVRVVECPR